MHTHRKVRITTDHPQAMFGRPVVLVDGELLGGVTAIEMDFKYSVGKALVKITLIGADIDLEGAPDYIVKVIGPKPQH